MPKVTHSDFWCLYLLYFINLVGMCLFFASWITLCKTLYVLFGSSIMSLFKLISLSDV